MLRVSGSPLNVNIMLSINFFFFLKRAPDCGARAIVRLANMSVPHVKGSIIKTRSRVMAELTDNEPKKKKKKLMDNATDSG